MYLTSTLYGLHYTVPITSIICIYLLAYHYPHSLNELQQMSLAQQYLSLYHALSTPHLSKHSNIRLLQIQSSQQAWPLAHSLLTTNHTLHGYQLISKKLNSPPPSSVSLPGLLEFMYSVGGNNGVMWLCVAKVMLHLSPSQPIMPQIFKKQQVLKVVKEIPSAIAQVRTDPPKDSNKLKKQYLQASLPLLVQMFQSYSQLVVGCVDSFVSHNIQLNSPALLLKLLQQPLQDVAAVLQQILGHQRYPQQQQKIAQYLHRNMQNPQIGRIFLQFYQQQQLTKLTPHKLTQVLSCVFNQLRRKDISLSDSYQFWNSLSLLPTQAIPAQSQQIILQGMWAVWQMTIQLSMLNQMPSVLFHTQALSLDHPQLYTISKNNQIDRANSTVQNFRNMASDFMQLVLNAFQAHPFYLAKVFQATKALAQGDVLQMELAVYVCHSIAEYMPKSLTHCRDTIIAVFGRQSDFNQYVCGKVIKMIGQLSPLFEKYPQILPLGLSFLLKCLNYQRLSGVASQSCCTLLQQATPDSLPNLQLFLGHLYEQLFKPLAVSAISNLSRCMALFFGKFKTDPSAYQQYLQYFSASIQGFQATRKANYIQAAISAQNCLNALKYKELVSSFYSLVNKQAGFILTTIITAASVDKLKEGIRLLNYLIKSQSVGNGELICQIIHQIMTKYMAVLPPIHSIITPLTTIAKLALEIDHPQVSGRIYNPQVSGRVVRLLALWHRPITQLLGHIPQGKSGFNLSNAVIQFHQTILQYIKRNLCLGQSLQYNPQPILSFISASMRSLQIWDYQLYKNSMIYSYSAIQLGSPPLPILANIFSNFNKIADIVWTHLQPIIFYAYKQGGQHLMWQAIASVKAGVDTGVKVGVDTGVKAGVDTSVKVGVEREGSLWKSLAGGLQRGQSKTIKNALMSLL